MSQSILKRIYWRILRASGFKRLSWDRQFVAGVWCRRPRSPHTVRRATELCCGGLLVEFGCGEGTLPLALPRDSFSHYMGYDISGVAIQRANERARMANLANCQFEQCDMAKWTGTSGASLIVAEECLYYLAKAEIETFLQRCCQSLIPGGSILVIVYSAARHGPTLNSCRGVCKVRDESVVDGRTFLTLTG